MNAENTKLPSIQQTIQTCPNTKCASRAGRYGIANRWTGVGYSDHKYWECVACSRRVYQTEEAWKESIKGDL